MAFLPTPALFHERRISLSTRPKRRTAHCPRMVEQNTLIAVATMVVGVGGGIGLVAWTEQQGKQGQLRDNNQPCAECRGETTVVCNVCNGTTTDSLDTSKVCTYCEGRGSIKCFNCAGSGIQPRFLDRLSPDDFMD